MTCGDGYAFLIRSSTGATPNDPCGMFCTIGDREEWTRPLDTDIAPRVRTRWTDLRRAELRAGSATPISEALRGGIVGQFEEATQAAHGHMFSGEGVEMVIKAGRLGACALEKIDQGFRALQGTAEPPDPYVPPPEPLPETPKSAPEEEPRPIPEQKPAPRKKKRALGLIAAAVAAVVLLVKK